MLADDPHAPAASFGPRAISTAGVSKPYSLAGARLGWVVADRELADTVRK
ncbi:aminotransferase class I/II-fold pyridoxal phosphate-dependent enzyme [Natrinema sp. 74]